MKLLKIFIRRSKIKSKIIFLLLTFCFLLFYACSTERLILRTIKVPAPQLDIHLPSQLHYQFADTIPLVAARIDTIRAQLIDEDLKYPSYIGILTGVHGDTVVRAEFFLKDYSFNISYKPDTILATDTIRLPGKYFELKGDDWTERIIWLAVSAIGIISVALYRRKKTTDNQQSIDN